MPTRVLDVDGVSLCAETFGQRRDPALLLLGGAASAMDWWEVEFCERLGAFGRFVIRYDYRDTGESVCAPPGAPDYTGGDLADDAIGLLDALGIERAHLAGLSMGGGLVQLLAAQRPERLLTATLISTSPAGADVDRDDLPPPAARVTASFAQPPADPDWNDRGAVIDHLVDGARPYVGDLGFDEPRVRAIATTIADRSPQPASAGNHGQLPDSGTSPIRLGEITVPTLVLHGTADPLFPIEHGIALAAAIPGATLVRLDGMGHEYPPPELWDIVVPELLRHTRTG